MPNTPMLVGEGMVGPVPRADATADDVAEARRIFESAGAVIEVAETQMDAVTAVSGSGPAYFFYLAEQMIPGRRADGAHAGAGARRWRPAPRGRGQDAHPRAPTPQELRRKVTSPGGTTQAAITHMESAGVGTAIVEALQGRRPGRSKELASRTRCNRGSAGLEPFATGEHEPSYRLQSIWRNLITRASFEAVEWLCVVPFGPQQRGADAMKSTCNCEAGPSLGLLFARLPLGLSLAHTGFKKIHDTGVENLGLRPRGQVPSYLPPHLGKPVPARRPLRRGGAWGPAGLGCCRGSAACSQR